MEAVQPLTRLIEELRRIPSIGAKTAQRIAYHILAQPAAEAEALAEAIKDIKKSLFSCSICNNITRVVEEPFNIGTIEKTGVFHGRYHVLLGVLAPFKGVGPDDLKLDKLLKRLNGGGVREVIIATNPTADGEATAHLLARMLRDRPLKLTRLAMGLPVGSDIDYADQVTMRKALEGRTEMKD